MHSTAHHALIYFGPQKQIIVQWRLTSILFQPCIVSSHIDTQRKNWRNIAKMTLNSILSPKFWVNGINLWRKKGFLQIPSNAITFLPSSFRVFWVSSRRMNEMNKNWYCTVYFQFFVAFKKKLLPFRHWSFTAIVWNLSMWFFFIISAIKYSVIVNRSIKRNTWFEF